MAINISEKTEYPILMSARPIDGNDVMNSGGKEAADTSVSLKAMTSGSNKDRVTTITALKNSSDRLMQAALNLTTSGKESLFWGIAMVSGEDDPKSVVKGQTKDVIYKQVSEFVSSYNGVLTSVAKSENTKVQSVTDGMQRMTVANEDSLAAVGVTIGKGNKLGISERMLKEVQTETLIKRLSDAAPYMNGIQTEASLIQMYAKEDASKTGGIYAQDAKYSNAYASSGYMFNGMI